MSEQAQAIAQLQESASKALEQQESKLRDAEAQIKELHAALHSAKSAHESELRTIKQYKVPFHKIHHYTQREREAWWLTM